MTQIAIKTQIDAIKSASENALRSKESALKFLVDAGILSPSTIPKGDDSVKTATTKK